MTEMELALRQSLDAMNSNLQSFIGITTQDDGAFYIRVDSLKHKRNVQRYIDLFCNGDQDIEEHDTRKLKITTYLLHMNDIPHIGEDFANKVWEHDLGVHFDGIREDQATFVFERAIDQQMTNITTRKCDMCYKIGSHHKLLKCGSCKMAYFCNTKCQELAWNGHHRKECKFKMKLIEKKSDLLVTWKQEMAWRFFLTTHKRGIFEFFDEVESKCGKKSKILLLTNMISYDDKVGFQFRTVSMRFFTSYKKTSMHGSFLTMKKFLLWNQILKSRPDTYMLAIPYNGYFNFFPII